MKDLAEVFDQEDIDNQGVWVPFGGEERNVLIAAAGNPDYNKKRIALEKQTRRKLSLAANKEFPEEVGELIQRRAIHGTVLKGWKGSLFLYDPETLKPGTPPPPDLPDGGKGLLPFTEENTLWYMERSRRFRKTVFGNATEDETFNRENLEILGKA